MMNVFFAVHDCACWKVRTLDVLEKILCGGRRTIYEMDSGVDYFAQIVRGNVSGHADGDAERAIEEQVWNDCRQYDRLLSRTFIVGTKVYCILVYILEELGGDA